MKRILKILAIVLIVGLGVIQIFQIDKTNPPIVAGQNIEASISVPADITLILDRSCNDCHTNNTKYPWYTSVQPAGWFMKDHINDGRRHLNFSEFNTYAPKKKAKKMEEVCEQVEAGEMPLPSYLWIHRDAGLSAGD